MANHSITPIIFQIRRVEAQVTGVLLGGAKLGVNGFCMFVKYFTSRTENQVVWVNGVLPQRNTNNKENTAVSILSSAHFFGLVR